MLATIQINPLLRTGTVGNIIKAARMKGELDLADNICEVDAILGGYKLDKPFTYDSTLFVYTELYLDDIRNSLYQKGVAKENIHSSHALLNYLSGSNGFLNCYEFVKKMSGLEICSLANLIHHHSKLQSQYFQTFNLGIQTDDESLMNIKICDIIDSYKISHGDVKFEDKNSKITIVPAYYWIHKLITKEK